MVSDCSITIGKILAKMLIITPGPAPVHRPPFTKIRQIESRCSKHGSEVLISVIVIKKKECRYPAGDIKSCSSSSALKNILS